MALLAVVMATGYRRVIAAFRRNPQIGSLMLAYFSVGVVYNCTEAAFFRMMTPVWMFLLLAITGAMVLATRSVRLPVGGGPDHEKHSTFVVRGWCTALSWETPGNRS